MKRGVVYRSTFLAVYTAAFGLLGYLAYHGWSYYATPLDLRARHDLYWDLKPGGRLGIRYGIAGASLMVIMLAYSLRKRWRPLRKAGPLRAWLDGHIVCGVIGPLFILLHTSFKVGGLVALSFWSMVAVALSGVLGRFLYLQLPRRRSGDEISAEEVRRECAELVERLKTEWDVPETTVETIEREIEASAPADAPLPLLLLRLAPDGWRLRRRLSRTLRDVEQRDPQRSRDLRDGVRRLAWLRRRMLLLSRLQELFHYWHVLHKPFALIMYLFMVVHIGVALATGYGFTWK